MTETKLRLIDSEEPTREMIAQARMEQSWREWTGINGQPWQPFSEPRERPTLDTDDVLRRTYRAEVDRPVPLLRRLLRRLLQIVR